MMIKSSTTSRRAGLARSLFAAGCAAMMLFSTVPAFAQKGRAPVASTTQNGSRSGGGQKVAPADTTNVRVISRVIDLSGATGNATPKSGVTTNAFPAAEGFDNITTLVPGGWFFQNNSTPAGTNPVYFQGNDTVFVSQAGATTSYIAVNFNSVAGANTISNWMLTPSGTLNNGDVISFFTRTVDNRLFADRLQVRFSVNGASTNVGTTATDVGDFTTLGLDINDGLTPTGYPNVWTQVILSLTGLPPGGLPGRIGFRYFVPDGGPSGSNSDYIGIDTFTYTPAAVSGPVNVDSQVSFTTTTQGLTGIAGSCATAGYTNQYNLNVDLRNIGTNTFTSPFFQVTELQQTDGTPTANPFRLRTADDFNAATCAGGLVGTTQAIPGPITPAQVVPVNFQIAMPQLRRFRFLVSVFATTTGSVTRNGKTVKLGNLAVTTTGFDKDGNPILSATFIPEKGQPSFTVTGVKVTPAR